VSIENTFTYSRRVHFYETDLMSYMHHSNYLRIFEECRAEWQRQGDLIQKFYPGERLALVVLETNVKHYRPALFDQLLMVNFQVRLVQARLEFQYEVVNESTGKLVATARTVHGITDGDLRLRRPTADFRRYMQDKPWSDEWPISN
jgi:acyl-CoA thioester hydrolase